MAQMAEHHDGGEVERAAASLVSARDRAVQAEAFTTELKALVASRGATRRDHARADDADRRLKSAPNS